MTNAGGTGARRTALDLAELVGLLRDAGFSPDTRRYLSANQLLLTLAERGVDLGDLATADGRARFVSHMAPVFCANAEEQARFAEIVDAWLGAKPAPGATRTAGISGSGSTDMHPASCLHRWSVAHRWTVIGLAASAAVIGAMVSFGRLQTCEQRVPPAPPTISSRARPTEGTVSSFRVSRSETIQLPALEPQATVAIDWTQAVGVGVIAGALALVASWWAGRPPKELALLRLPAVSDGRARAFGLECVPPDPLTGPEVRRLVGSLRRPREQTDVGLDIVATAKASADAAGLFTPINRPRRRMPVYVALLSRRSTADHQTRLRELLLDQLVKAGVSITRYYFDDDPRVCQKVDASTRAILLDELAVLEQDATLLLFTEAASCVDPLSGDLAAWVAKMTEWHHRVLFTPDAPYCWGAAERLLAAAGFIVLPDGPQGFKMYGELRGDWSIDQVPAPYARAYPSLLSGESRRWLDRHVPPPETRDKLLRQLRGYLGPHGFAWLAACAVYPEISWPLTIRLADVLPRLFPDEPPADPLKNLLPSLARLPWLRHAYLPDWLRIALLRQLGPERERAVRDHLTILLNDLKIVPRDALEIVPLRGAASPGADGENAGDAVYLGFMSGATLDPLGLLAPEHLRGVFRGLSDLPQVGAPPAARTRWQRLVQQWRGTHVFAPTWRRLAVSSLIAMILGASATGGSVPFLSTVTSGSPGSWEDVAFDGATPVVAGRVGTVVKLSRGDRQELSTLQSQANGTVQGVALSRDGITALVVHDSGVEAFRWQSNLLAAQATRFELPEGAPIWNISIGRTVAAGMGSRAVGQEPYVTGIWNLDTGTFTPLSIAQPVSVSVSANDDTIGVAHRGRSEYGGVALFDARGQPRANDAALPRGGRSVVSAVAVHDADVSAYGMADGTVGLTRRASRDWVWLGTPGEQSLASVTVLRFSADGRWLAAAGAERVLLWDLAGRDSRAQSAGDAPPSKVAPNAYNAVQNQARSETAPSAVVALAADGAVRSLAFAENGRTLAALTDTALNVWQLERLNENRAAASSSFVRPTATAVSTRVPETASPLPVARATAASATPRVYLHVPSERDAKTLAASGLLDLLKKAGFEVPPIDVKPGPKDGIEIRYFRAEAGGAETLQRVFKAELGLAVRLQDFDNLAVKQEPRPLRYEAWFAPGMADIVAKAMYGRPRQKGK